MIRILTGPVRSGKTTALMNWSAGRSGIGGVLTPDVDGLRMLFNVKDRTRFSWQKEAATSDDDVRIGRFVFDQNGFDAAVRWLDGHLNDPSIHTIILDEIGPLELQGKGWAPWLEEALRALNQKDLIVVVRQQLVEEVVKRFMLEDYGVCGKEDFLI